MSTALSPSVHPESSKTTPEAQNSSRHLQSVEHSRLAVDPVPTLSATNIRQAALLDQVALDPRKEYAPAELLSQAAGSSNVFLLQPRGVRNTMSPSDARLHADIKNLTKRIGSAFIEAELGIRPFAQLASWLELDLFHKLKARVHYLAAQRHLAARSGEEASRKLPSVVPVGVRAAMRPSGDWESSMTIRVGDRARALAMRLQTHRNRWRVIAFEVG